MSLLHEIQEAIIEPTVELGPVLLKLRLLADRLGSEQLEEWVKYESEGYPPNVEVPEYRYVEVSYTGNFQNIAWQATNQPIPPYLIEEHCGKQWTRKAVRESIAAVDELLKGEGGAIGIDAANLVLILQDKVYEGMNCTSVNGRISRTSILEIQNTVRARILELTMKLEKEIPGTAEITVAKRLESGAATEKLEHVVNMTVNGPNAVITTGGAHSRISVNNVQGDVGSIENELVKAGVPKDLAEEFSQIVASEHPESQDAPLGAKATEWLGKKLPSIAKGAWGIGVSVATSVIEEAAKNYYGLR
jgi:hypothetical protein